MFLDIAGLLRAELGFGTLVLVALVPGPEKLLTAALELRTQLGAVCQTLVPEELPTVTVELEALISKLDSILLGREELAIMIKYQTQLER